MSSIPGRPAPTAARHLALIALLGLLVLPVGAQDFPPAAGIDEFPSGAPLSITVNGVTYETFAGADNDTMVGRSAPIGEGDPMDVGGTPVPTGACTACAPMVLDADLTCWPDPPPPPTFEAGDVDELHTEMLSLDLCGPITVGPPGELCYLAGQPAFDALMQVGAAGLYQNSFGEVEPMDPDQPDDFPASSFWDLKGVFTVDPPPPGTSGVFVLADLTDSILLVVRNVEELPPEGASYTFEAGTREPLGAGGPCGQFPIPVADALAPGAAIGEVGFARHDVDEDEDEEEEDPDPKKVRALGPLGVIGLVVALLGIAAALIVRRM